MVVLSVKKCNKCKVDFQPNRRTQKFCSHECRKISIYVQRTCLFCSKTWSVRKYSGSQYCSNSCHSKSSADPSNRIERICINCETKFITWKNCKLTHKYCSRSCARQISSNKSKWYKIDDIMCQGTYELAFVDWCKSNNVDVKFSRTPIKYLDDEQKQRTYYPDFWIPEWNSYVDVKSNYTKKFSIRKFELLRMQRSDLLIKVLDDDALSSLGVDISYKNRHQLEIKHSTVKESKFV